VTVMCGTLEYELAYAWNIHSDELGDYWIRMYRFVVVDVLGGTTEIEPSSGQGHPMGGTCRWFAPPHLLNANIWNVLLWMSW
jgi:hypothetical protein